jgi:hypothetical protein
MGIEVGFSHGENESSCLLSTLETGNVVIIRCSLWVASDLSASVITPHGR